MPRASAGLAAALFLGWLLPATPRAEPAPYPDPFWESALAVQEPAGTGPAPAVLVRKLERKHLQAQKRPVPYTQPSQAQEFFLLKRAPAAGRPLPVERYLDAVRHMKQMSRHSTRQGGRLLSPPPATTSSSELDSAAPLAASTAALGAWTPLGPGNVGGRTRAILIDPVSPGTMYAAGVAGGVWKTTDGGAAWVPLTDLIANLAVNSMAMDPLSPSVIYAGTGEGYFNIDGVRGAGIFKTQDGGATWAHLASTNNASFHYVNDIVVSPNNTQRVYAATRTGVWRSLDGGASWSQVLSPGITGGCLDLALRPDQPTDYLFASCGTFAQATIYRNTNAGGAGSWVGVFSEAGMGRTSLAIAPSNPAVVYALSASIATGTYQDGLHAVFRSEGSGDPGSWTARVRNSDPTKLNTVLLTNTVFAFLTECGFGISEFFNQGWYDNVIAVDPVDPNRVWAGGIDLFRSDDGGASWGLASHWWADSVNPRYAHADQHAMVFHPQYNGTTNRTLFVGNDGGVFRSDNARAATATGPTAPCDTNNGSVSWTERNNGYGVTQFYHGVPYPAGATYFGGTQDNGTVRGTDGAGVDGWAEILGGDGGHVAVDPGNSNVLYAENTGLSIQKSTDGGASFTDAVSGITESPANFLFIAPFTMDPGNAQRLWTGGVFLWRTTNGAASWSRASAITAGAGSVSAIGVAPTDGNRVLAGMSDGIIHRTTVGLSANAGTSWPFVQPRTGYVSSLAFDPTNADLAYATYSTFGGTHVWKSTDGGASWVGIDGTGATAIPDIPAHSIVVDPTTPSRLYVGTDLGVFVSRDGGVSWAVEHTGFANVITEALAVGSLGTTPSIFAFTHGRGAWRVTSADVNPVPAATSLDPSSAPAGSPEFTLTVNGSSFVSTSVVRWNGLDRTTTFVSSGQLQAAIPASDLFVEGTAPVVVFNPASGGGTSNALPFTITAPVPIEVILDNAPVGVQDEQRMFSGTWCVSGVVGSYGTDSLYSCGGGGDSYRWRPAVLAASSYDVYVWWTSDVTRSTAVPITVVHLGGATTRTFNEQTGGGQWVLHGRYSLSTGGYVQVSAFAGQAVADAVRFVPVAGEPLPTVTVAATGATAAEAGLVPGTFTVSRTGSTAAALTVVYTVGGTATVGSDYQALSGSVTIPIGDATGTIPVTPLDDELVEPDETVVVTLSANAAYTVGAPGSATVTITSDDVGGAELIVDNAGAGVQDPAGGRTFTGAWCVSGVAGFYGANSLYSCGGGLDTYRWTPTLPGAGSYDVYVRWTAHANRSATVPITVSHAAGATTRTFDQRSNGGQWVLHGRYSFNAGTGGYVQLSDANGLAVADAVRFVEAGEALPTVTIAATDATATEAGLVPGTLTVSRTGSTAAALTVVYTVGGTATAGSDYQALSGSVTIPIGAATGAIPVTPLDDGLVEPDETVVVTLSANAAYTVGAPGSATVTITSDDVGGAELIVDNAGAGVQDPAGGRTFTGAWCASGVAGFYGADSLYSCGGGVDTYRWTPTIPAAGSYDVYVRWTAHANRSATVPITVSHAAGATTRTFDQRVNGGQWVLHGRYSFAAGTGGYVQLSDANGLAVADAVRFVP